MPRKPGSSGLAYKKMQADSMFGDSIKQKPVVSDSTRVGAESATKAAARNSIKQREPADLWHHYNNSVMDVNAGMKLYPKVKK